MDLAALQEKINNYITVVSSWVRNVGKLYFSGTAEDVTVQMIDDNGNVVDTTLPNVAQFRKTVWDDVGGAIGQFNRTVYVDALNGDDLNNGNSVTPFKTLSKALSVVPNGGLITIRLSSDVTWDNTVLKSNAMIRIELNGFTLSLLDYTDSGTGNQFLYGLSGYGNILYFYGSSNSTSTVVIPANATANSVNSYHGCLVKTAGGGDAKNNALHFGYTVTVKDNGDYFLISAKEGVATFSQQGLTIDSTASRVFSDFITGLILDANGVPRNLQSNEII